ncbi:hypothetical protein GCM10007962_13860 [Yeosuana aromativorans]|uniref:NlpC/P60 domain-containing protein n=2 Tax=Yeosuana aromativorans TaxID=288019 RepID=A0A8J3BKG7_9FLAO|nr:hypothetical protein GCM10007962_13860 [Yeosuana aromativorans]
MGCGSSKHAITDKTTSSKVIIHTNDVNPIKTAHASSYPLNDEPNAKPSNNLALNIVDYAKQFEGVRYKYGGTTKKGMDCSGLVYTSFKAYDIDLPRISRNMAKEGEPIPLEQVKVGDLLFFKTNGKHNAISHVGMVVTALPGNVEFIHASTSLGVIISSLAERYWYFSFVEARRIL